MPKTPHKDKLAAAIANPKSRNDLALLKEALADYTTWVSRLDNLKSSGKQRVLEATELLNGYKDNLEVELIAARGSDFLKRQKGQLKLDNSVMEEFLMHLVHPEIMEGLPPFALDVGPHNAFMTFSFRPSGISSLNGSRNSSSSQKIKISQSAKQSTTRCLLMLPFLIP